MRRGPARLKSGGARAFQAADHRHRKRSIGTIEILEPFERRRDA